jgi:hypothetical protein
MYRVKTSFVTRSRLSLKLLCEHTIPKKLVYKNITVQKTCFLVVCINSWSSFLHVIQEIHRYSDLRILWVLEQTLGSLIHYTLYCLLVCWGGTFNVDCRDWGGVESCVDFLPIWERLVSSYHKSRFHSWRASYSVPVLCMTTERGWRHGNFQKSAHVCS